MFGKFESNYKWPPHQWKPREEWIKAHIQKLEKEVEK